MPAHKDKHMIGTCPDCPDGLEQDKPPSLREALEAYRMEHDHRAESLTQIEAGVYACPCQTCQDACAALDAPERTGYDLTQEIDKLTIANVNLLGLLRGLTYMGTMPDGRIMIGPHGWRLAQEAIAGAERE